VQPTVLLHSWFAVVASGKPLLWNLAPLRRGFFVRLPPLRCVQPTVRLGVAVLRRDRQVLLMTNDGPTLAPLLWRGFCLGAPLHKMLRPAAGPALCNQPPAASLSGRVDPTSAGWSTRAKCGRKLSPASLSLWCAGLFLWPVASATNEEPHL